jgi:uncharacterized protein YceK
MSNLVLVSIGCMLLAGCASIAQPAYVDDSAKSKSQDCQSQSQNSRGCSKTSAAK